MEDEKIIELYWQRNETAIQESQVKYGGLCSSVAANILADQQDCEECLNDTWLGAWNAIPPAKPGRLGAFLAKITRNLALKKFGYLNADKRSSFAADSIEEPSDCVSGNISAETEAERLMIEQVINAFLGSLTPEKRRLFVWRYWYFYSVEDISRRTGYSKSKVKSMLFRLRRELKNCLEKEEVEI
ncbi:MAG: sigma-70 family RNA polymerase sigma factor [Firmicutes bacterium]|nr:sigma-70 family RNA polymerase sigma factor [Bacillota bacterium]